MKTTIKTKKIIPAEYHHWLPYTYTHLRGSHEEAVQAVDLIIGKGSMPKIQNNASQIITFYKTISRF
jgi:hypothetical protein